jgi:3'-phosphoadenosine 5'-phosphosulfate sulfotransferase (PAPS reductase)/FAD synthetase
MRRLTINFSGGKDSTAMLLLLLEREPDAIHSIVFFDTGWEFPEMLAHINLVEQRTGQQIQRITPRTAFDELLQRYGWPGFKSRWCTRIKVNALKRYAKEHDTVPCIGIAFDESKRISGEILSRPARFPLYEWEMTEAQCLEYCIERGYDWGGLYRYRKRVSCYCCPLQRKGDVRNIMLYHPKLWASMKGRGAALQKNTHFGSNKYTLADYEKKWSAQNCGSGCHMQTTAALREGRSAHIAEAATS